MNSIPKQILFFIDLSTPSSNKRRSTIDACNQEIEQLKKSHPKSQISIFQFDGKQLQCTSYSVGINDQTTLFFRETDAVTGPVLDAIGACIGTWRAFANDPIIRSYVSLFIFSSIKDNGSVKYSVCSLHALFQSLKKENWNIQLHSMNPLAPQIATKLEVSLASHQRRVPPQNQFLLAQLKRQWMSQQKNNGNGRSLMEYAA